MTSMKAIWARVIKGTDGYAYSWTQPFHFWEFSLYLTCLMMCEHKGHYSKFLKWQKTKNYPRTHQWRNWLNKLCYIHTIEFYVCSAKKEWGNTLCTATEISPRYIVMLKETRCGTVWRNSYCLYYKAGGKSEEYLYIWILLCVRKATDRTQEQWTPLLSGGKLRNGQVANR